MTTRRKFLKTAGVGAMAAPLADRPARMMVDIRMNAPWKRVRPPSRAPAEPTGFYTFTVQ